MPREIITIECTEARKEGKSPSRYTTTRNKKLKTEKLETQEVQSGPAPPHAASRNQVSLCLAKLAPTNRTGAAVAAVLRLIEMRTPRPKPKIDFTVDALDFKNVNLLRQFVTDQGRILPRKYTGLPAHYQRRLNRAIKRARQMLLMK